jgi:hypothetical protein
VGRVLPAVKSSEGAGTGSGAGVDVAAAAEIRRADGGVNGISRLMVEIRLSI